MKLRLSYIIYRAVAWHRGSYITIALVAALIAGVITASLLAGQSVRQTLAANTLERLNGGGIMVSAGLRYSDRDLGGDLQRATGVPVAPLMELNGRVTAFGGSQKVSQAKIWGVDSTFFSIDGTAYAEPLLQGEAILNLQLAEALQVKVGESIIVRFQPPSDLPRNTPFSPSKEEEGSLFLAVKEITDGEAFSVFNPAISQVLPLNIFVSISEFDQFMEGRNKGNRFLMAYNETLTVKAVETALAEVSVPGGQSLRIRSVPATGETELISDRIFIDDFIVKEITKNIEGARPVLTYLANSISSESGSTPYSFISAISGADSATLPEPFDIIINEWLATDLMCGVGDSVTVTYFLSGADNSLAESSSRFRVSAIVPLTDQWRDSLLMPAFPGITGSRSCTDWDAGIPLDMKRIRDKDEQYWFDHAGTPKGFIRYETGAALWGNQFGPATSIRWAAGDGLQAAGDGPPEAGALRALTSIGGYGFTVTDLRSDGLKAATSGVDFSMLFLSLSFFIIISALVLLVMVIDNHLRTREGEISAYTALGFRQKKIRSMFMGETLVPVAAGAIAGAGLGILFNILIINALNSVWIGAVQTDTLRPFTGIGPVATGAVATLLVAMMTLRFRIVKFLRTSAQSVRERAVPTGRMARIALLPLALLTLLPVLLIAFTSVDKILLHFLGGTFLLAFMLVFSRYIITRRYTRFLLSLRYYAFYPARAITPVLFIAAGLFIVISTGANRQDFGRDALRRSSGTGGFTHWVETANPVDAPLNLSGAETVMSCLRVDGDDASCLNLNLVTSPHILGVDAAVMAERQSFSFASGLPGITDDGFWEALTEPAGANAIYGFLDQTVMQWGMKVKPGDTITIRSESGQPLHIILAGGFKTSVFQGYLVVDKSHFAKWFPSVSGGSVLLVEMPVARSLLPDAEILLSDAIIQTTPSRLESFNRVTNTYLSVFVVLGGLGMILGVTGLGLNLVRNIRSRRKEFALLSASGYTYIYLRRMLLAENLAILIAGIIAGTLPAIFATWPSLAAGNSLPWTTIAALVILMLLTGTLATLSSIRVLTKQNINTSRHNL